MAGSAIKAALRQHKANLLLGGLIVSLAAAVAVEAMPDQAPETAPSRPLRLPKLDTSSTDAAKPSGQWQETVLSRPLFALDRRPLPTEATADGTMPRLSGTIRFADTALAIFEIPPSGTDTGHAAAKSLVVGVGAEVAGWTIQNVADERVLLIRAGEVRALDLAFSKAPRPVAKGLSAIRVLHGKKTNVFFQP